MSRDQLASTGGGVIPRLDAICHIACLFVSPHGPPRRSDEVLKAWAPFVVLSPQSPRPLNSRAVRVSVTRCPGQHPAGSTTFPLSWLGRPNEPFRDATHPKTNEGDSGSRILKRGVLTHDLCLRKSRLLLGLLIAPGMISVWGEVAEGIPVKYGKERKPGSERRAFACP